MTDIVADWRELLAGPALSSYIAAKFGWVIRERESGAWELLNPDGAILHLALGQLDLLKYIPRYSTDLNEAIKLWDGTDTWGVLSNNTHIPTGRIYWRAQTSGRGGHDPEFLEEAEHADPAMAICRSWLAYKEASA